MMRNDSRRLLVGIAGGSGAGKSWLAQRLFNFYAPRAGRISLDSFYLDRSHLPLKRRDLVNFDHPRAIDWPLFEKVLREVKDGAQLIVPAYDFKTHCRMSGGEQWIPKNIVLVDGLWLLWRKAVRELFDITIFLDCAEELRLARRVARDVTERGRSEVSVRRQFKESVAPMHEKFVVPQKRLADLVFVKELTQAEEEKIVARIAGMGADDSPRRYAAGGEVRSDWQRAITQ
jgi:uridine kinase